MKASIEIPVILEEQQKIVNWSRSLREQCISFSTIVEHLVTDEASVSEIINNGLHEVQEIYKRYNNAWREQVLLALTIDNYRFKNDIKEGQIVTNGEYIGYAFYIDCKTRDFALYSSKDRENQDWVGNFKMDDFKSR